LFVYFVVVGLDFFEIEIDVGEVISGDVGGDVFVSVSVGGV